MGLEKITSGENPPEQINAVIEIPARSSMVKYEIDKTSGCAEVDRFMNVPMHYPCNYGFIPQTLAEDGDPLDVLVVTPVPLMVAALIRCHPLDVLEMTDESGRDIKLLAKPAAGMNSGYDSVDNIKDLSENLCQQIVHFFLHYKKLEPKKWTKVGLWLGKEAAYKAIVSGMERYRQGREEDKEAPLVNF